MRSYDLTERGKIIIAVVLVLLILVLPAVILAVKAWNSSQPAPDNPSQTVDPVDPGTDISEKPLPDGSDFTPVDPPETGNGEQGSFDPPGDHVPEFPTFGPIGINIHEGTMQFLFSPHLQDVLDADTISMMEDFIASPKNIENAQILVEIPQLSEEESSDLIKAVTRAFAQYDVSSVNLSFAIYEHESDDKTFEVKMSFVVPPATGK